MRAFHDDPAIKRRYLRRVAAHRRADQIAQGVYYDRRSGRLRAWTEGRTIHESDRAAYYDRRRSTLRACAVGCTIHGSDHSAYERELGIPTWLAQLEDCIHEGLLPVDCREWPGQFLRAVPVGADLDPIRPAYFVELLDMTTPAVIREGTWASVMAVRDLWARVAAGEVVAPSEWAAAREAAADAADDTDADAVWSASTVAADAAAAAAAAAAAVAATFVAADDDEDAAAAPAEAASYAADAWLARCAFYGDLRDWLLRALAKLSR